MTRKIMTATGLKNVIRRILWHPDGNHETLWEQPPLTDIRTKPERNTLVSYRTTSTFGSVESGNDKWLGSVLAPNGKIYGIPRNSTSVLEIDPVARTASTFGSLSGTNKWLGGVLAPNGKIYGMPCNSTSVLEIDPVARTTSTFGSVGSETNKWFSSVLAPNGKIYGIPCNSTTVLEISTSDSVVNFRTETLLSAYLNKT